MKTSPSTITILGSGAWGTALAQSCASQPSHTGAVSARITLWGRDAAQVREMARTRQNTRYLPGVTLHPAIALQSDLSHALEACLAADAPALIFLACPLGALRRLLTDVAPLLRAHGQSVKPTGNQTIHLINLAKGIEPGTALLPHPIMAQTLAQAWSHHAGTAVPLGISLGTLSGPSFAEEVAAGLPAALCIASQDDVLTRHVMTRLHSPTLRVYANADVLGVELAGAAKNVLAIASGICDGLQLGANARAALITRGLAEISRLGLALGARLETFLGLAGVGDVILTTTGQLSRNRRVGLALARGEQVGEVLRQLGHVAEGVHTAPALIKLASQHGVDMPVCQSVAQVLSGERAAMQAMREMMSREAKAEMPLDA